MKKQDPLKSFSVLNWDIIEKTQFISVVNGARCCMG